MSHLYCIGLSHRAASATEREAMLRSAGEATLRRAVELGAEAMLLGTCNRVELYLGLEAGRELPCALADLGLADGADGAAAWRRALTLRLEDAQAVRHLARVAAGLDAAVLGDVQVVGQLKAAAATARRLGSLGPTLRRAVDHALAAGRRAHRETDLGVGAASVGSALAEMVRAELGEAPRIALLGAGDAARHIASHLARRGARLTILNRTDARAEALAAEQGARAGRWVERLAHMGAADAVVTATSAPRPVITAEDCRAVREARGAPARFFDAGLPRNVAPCPEARITDIDAIRDQQGATLERRRAAAPRAEQIVDEEVARWGIWHACLPLERSLRELYGDVAAHSRAVAEEITTQPELTEETAERLVSRAMKRLLHAHARRVRALAPTGGPKV